MHESDLKMHQYVNRSGYQATHEEFLKQEYSKCDVDRPIEGPVQVHEKFPCVEQIWDASMKIVHHFHHSIGPFFELFGKTQDNKRMYPFL